MSKVLRTTTILLMLHAVHSYILLTANIEDVQNVAKRLVQLPINGKVGNIMRRAYDVFNTQLGKARAQMRSDDGDIVLGFGPRQGQQFGDSDFRRKNNQGDVDGSERDQEKEKHGGPQEGSSGRRDNLNRFSALGRSASVYLQKIKKIFENA